MIIITNEKMIRRNARIGQISSMVGLLVLGGGLYISFRIPEQVALAWTALLVGFMLSQVGIFFGNQWGRRPRPDEHLDQALKGLDDRFTIYHYSTPVPHLLIGPAGIWALLPRHQIGKIVYEKNRWRQKKGGLLQGYLRIFAQEGLGRPDLDIANDLQSIKRYLEKTLPDIEFPEPQAALIFTNDRAEIEADDAPTPTLPARKLKEWIRKSAKEKSLSPDKAQKLKELFGE